MTQICFELPIRTVSEANCTQHWTKKSARHKSQQRFIRLAFSNYVPLVKMPCTVTLARLSPRLLDDDNLVSAFKWVRDELSDCLFGIQSNLKGRSDSNPLVTWKYAQRKHPLKLYAVEVLIEF